VLRLDGDVELARYSRILQGFDAFLSQWEPRLAAALPQRLLPWFAGRSRAPLARKDLQALGAQRLDGTAAMPDLPDLAAALGSLYVIEGSALGGQVIARGLASRHAIGPETGGAYFWGWGAETGARWREFRALLESELADDAAAGARACDAAVQTFEALTATFRELLHEREPAAT